jgi:hypothetical protein
VLQGGVAIGLRDLPLEKLAHLVAHGFSFKYWHFFNDALFVKLGAKIRERDAIDQ